MEQNSGLGNILIFDHMFLEYLLKIQLQKFDQPVDYINDSLSQQDQIYHHYQHNS